MNDKELIEKLENAAALTGKSLKSYLDNANVKLSEINEISRGNLISLIASISSSGARLNRHKILPILKAAGFDPELLDEEDNKLRNIFESGRLKPFKVSSIVETDKSSDIIEFKATISELSSKLDRIRVVDEALDKGYLDEIKNLFNELSKSSNKISAPIKLPAPKDMEIKLVSSDSLERMNEYQDNINVFLSLGSVFLGASLGILGNALISTSIIKRPSILLSILLILITAVFFILYKRESNRAKELRKGFFNNESSIDLDEYIKKEK